MITWTDSAIADLIAIKDYIKRDSEFFAQRFVESIFEQVEHLVMFPKIGRRVTETDNENIREILFQNYRIIYKLNNEQIFVLAIIHQAKKASFSS
ncbi:MAG TPA: type II toxin-antitoxin system RelE/ParE family toxin [Caldisericia bacterium]|jgi:toxin ParE1/3/4|nr:type II toxin-antitoxin system RelE/ParE family toxin [Caldisericia bacterium]